MVANLDITPGWEIVDIEQEFSQLLGGRRIDMVNPRHLNRHLKERILRTAVLQYLVDDEQ